MPSNGVSLIFPPVGDRTAAMKGWRLTSPRANQEKTMPLMFLSRRARLAPHCTKAEGATRLETLSGARRLDGFPLR
jgi:hypothetical protein